MLLHGLENISMLPNCYYGPRIRPGGLAAFVFCTAVSIRFLIVVETKEGFDSGVCFFPLLNLKVFCTTLPSSRLDLSLCFIGAALEDDDGRAR